MIEAAIFDMDGVIIDSVEIAHRARTNVLKEHGVDLSAIPDPHNEQHRGGSMKNLLAEVAKHTGLVLDPEELSKKARVTIFEELEKNHASTDPALLGFLQELKSQGVKLAIATSASRESTVRKLKLLKLEKFFKVVVTGNDVSEHKPSPASYLEALRLLGADPAKSVVFEDSAAGVAAGLAAGCKVIVFTKYNAEQMDLPGTSMVIKGWEEAGYKQLAALV